MKLGSLSLSLFAAAMAPFTALVAAPAGGPISGARRPGGMGLTPKARARRKARTSMAKSSRKGNR